jgi:hypothetical protein
MAIRKELLPRLLKLPASERARIAFELVNSLDESEDSDANEVWLSELDERAREVLSLSGKLEDWATVRRRIEARARRTQR